MTEVVLDASGRRATGVRYLDIAAGNVAREVRAAHVVLAAGAFETPRLLLRMRRRQLVGPGRPQPHVPLPDVHGRHLPVLAARRAGPQRDPPARRLHRRRTADAMAAARDARPAVDPRRHRRARRRRHARSRRRSPTRPAPQHNRVDARLRAPRPALGVHDAGARTSPQPTTASTSTRRSSTRGASRRAGSRTRPTATSSSRPTHFAPDPRGGDARRRRRLRVLDHVAPAGRSRPARARARSASRPRHARHGHVPHGRRPARRRSSTPSSRFHDVDNMLCADSSVFVTSVGYNPTLTLVALAHRAACLLASVEV